MTPCAHHWLCGPQHDGRVDGVCRRCGAQRMFDASPAVYGHTVQVRRPKPWTLPIIGTGGGVYD